MHYTVQPFDKSAWSNVTTLLKILPDNAVSPAYITTETTDMQFQPSEELFWGY